MELEDLFKDRSQEQISAFAFSTGKMIEEAIRVSSNNATEDKKKLEGLILTFRVKLSKEQIFEPLLAEFDRHFGIEFLRTGKTEEHG